jgi:flagellar biosynthesis protein FlhF
MKNLKTFQAKTMADAMAQVKRVLGRDAVILHTRTVTQGGLLGIGGQPLVEVTATTGGPDLPPAVRRSIVRRAAAREANTGCADTSTMHADGISPPSTLAGDRDLLAELAELRAMIEGHVRDARRWHLPELPCELQEAYTRLIQTDVAEDLAAQIVEEVRGQLDPAQLADPDAVRERLAAYIESMLPVAGPIRLIRRAEPTLIAIIGPTGVGKTTTIAKLAANFSLREHRKVGLITIDTYRIAAVEQLKTYAQIVNVPLEVVMTPSQLRHALDRMRDRDIVLLDTAGRSQNDQIKINELRCFLEEARPHEVHLVLSGTCSQRVLGETIERFGPLGVNRVIFTKLDEAVGFGAILSCLNRAKAKLSYITAGQDVPEDIEVGRSRRVAELIVDGDRVAPCPA